MIQPPPSNKPNPRNVHSNIRNARNASGMTQQELADRVGVHVRSVSDWENHAVPRQEVAAKIAEALGVTVHDLFADHDTTITVLMIMNECKARIANELGISETRLKLMMKLVA